MISQAIQDAIRRAAESSDFRALFDHVADDVELSIAVTAGPRGVRQCRGKRCVIDRLFDIGDAGWRAARRVEFVVHDDRVVALRDEPIVVPTGLLLRCECAMVFDVHDGAITHIALNHELSPVWQPAARRLREVETL
jgi:ketosteroid isomerase-like protein